MARNTNNKRAASDVGARADPTKAARTKAPAEEAAAQVSATQAPASTAAETSATGETPQGSAPNVPAGEAVAQVSATQAPASKAAETSATGETPQAAAQVSATQAPASNGAAKGETLSASSITETPPSSLSNILDQMAEAADQQEQHLAKWVEKTKVAVDAKLLRFSRLHQAQVHSPIPANVLDLVPLAITDAVSGSMLAGFREVMHFTRLHRSFEQTALYEAAGTIWMLNPVGDLSSDSISISQLESAMKLWSEEAFLSSATQPMARRYSFDVPLPAKVVDSNVAQRKKKGEDTVVFAQPVPLLAGRPVVIAWYGAMSEALERAASGAGQDDVRDLEHRVLKLFEAALSVPIRLRLNPDPDNCRLLPLRFSEQAIAAMGAWPGQLLEGRGEGRRARRLQEIRVS